MLHRATLTSLLVTFILIPTATSSNVGNIHAISANCSSDTTPCGPQPGCCPVGLKCNYNRGIPVCGNPGETSLSGFDTYPCADPYYFRCDQVTGIEGFCCPIGTICRIHGGSTTIQCINALGETSPPIPSATVGLVPVVTGVSESNIFLNTSKDWKTAQNDLGCSSSSLKYTTETVNASISVNYTGVSIMVYTHTSPTGGMFEVWVDGYNTSSIIDTFVGSGDNSTPPCYPLQYPPFVVTPPGYASRNTHNITLMYVGPSDSDGAPMTGVNVTFIGFAMPELNSTMVKTGLASAGIRFYGITYVAALVSLTICVVLL